MSFEKIITRFTDWSLPTFKEANPISSLKKLNEEVQEIVHEFCHSHENLLEEYADCVMCLFDSAARAGYDVKHITEAIDKKFEKNKNREWRKNPDNTYSHIKP